LAGAGHEPRRVAVGEARGRPQPPDGGAPSIELVALLAEELRECLAHLRVEPVASADQVEHVVGQGYHDDVVDE
jgi:hypothetical protein